MIDEDDIFEEFEYVPLETPRRSPDTGFMYTHIAIPKENN